MMGIATDPPEIGSGLVSEASTWHISRQRTKSELAKTTFNHSVMMDLIRTNLLILVCALGLPAFGNAADDDLIIADFETAGWGDWRATGDAFGPGPAQGTLPNQMKVDGFLGKGLVNSFVGGDGSVGTLTSKPFTIERPFIRFLIGGGKDVEKTCMNLVIAGKVVRNATGPNDKPGGSETLIPAGWDVKEFAGQIATIQIIDQATGGWGHVNVDHIVQTSQKPPLELANVTREFMVGKPYLNLPIKNGGPKRKVTLLAEGRPVVINDIELADAQPDWWAVMDVSAWRGKTVTLQVDKLREDSTALSSIELGDGIKAAADLYKESSRGQFHFSSRRGWNNDPNGLVLFKGEYHLFYQHNPYGWDWGNMHWGHAVSRDLVQWQELGEALAPDSFGPMFSGSAVVDWKNTSGLGSANQPPLILIYTAAGDPTVQCIASSTDGRQFTKFSGNPVLKQITGGNRDPKVMWHAPSKQWVMVLYVEVNKVHTIQFFGSKNLKDWTFLSQTDGLFECPDFFELPVDGSAADAKWVLTAASSEYFVGSFDGVNFKPETAKLPGHRGRGFYAAQTFSDIPAKDGRRIQIGWFQTSTPGMAFNQSMTIPQELKLTRTPEGPRMTRTPVKELKSLRVHSKKFSAATLNPESANPLAQVRAELVEAHVEFEPNDASEIVFTIRGARISYDVKKQELAVNDHRTPAPLHHGKQGFAIYCDRQSLEVFSSDGLTYVPMPFIPKTEDRTLNLQAKGGSVMITTLEIHELKSQWR